MNSTAKTSDDVLTKPESFEKPLSLPAQTNREGILSRSFLGLLVTQFLGALNDNLIRWLVAYVGGDCAIHDPWFPKIFFWISTEDVKVMADQYKAIAVSGGLVCLILPYLLFAAPAGFFADRFSKRTIIVSCKVIEIVLMMLGTIAILHGNVWLMFLVVFMMGCHSAIFSPSKYGSIPEIVRAECLPVANGLVGMTTILAIVTGTVGAGFLYQWSLPAGQTRWWLWAATLVGVACLGTFSSLFIRKLPVANRERKFPINIFADTYRDFRILASSRSLFLAAVGSTLFWAMGGLVQINTNNFGEIILHLSKPDIGILVGIMCIGVGVGNVFAGVISRGKIVFVLVPLGAFGIAVAHILLFVAPRPLAVNEYCLQPVFQIASGLSGDAYVTCLIAAHQIMFLPVSAFGYWFVAGSLFLLGLSGGAYDVPLQAYLQYRSPEQNRGSVFAATNFMTFAGTIAATGIYVFLSSNPFYKLAPHQIFLLTGLVMFPLILVMIRYLAFDSARFLVIVLIKMFYRVKVEGLENIPEGGVVVTPNHVSFADGLLIGITCPRHPRMVVFADYFESPWLGWFGRLGRVILIRPGKKSIIESLRLARESLKNGEIVGLFPEGGISRDGKMKPFQPGLLTILKGTDAPVVPAFIDGMWGSIFSFKGGKFFWKIPPRMPRPLTIRFGKPLYNISDIDEVRRAVIALGSEYYE